MRARRCAAALLAVATSTACAVGPNYARPPVVSPEAYREQVGAIEATSIADLPWWEVFEDPVLQQLHGQEATQVHAAAPAFGAVLVTGAAVGAALHQDSR